MVSQQKRDANRANAQKSTGPRTPEGKSASSQNPSSHGAFCRHLVLPGEDEHRFLVLRRFHLRRGGTLAGGHPPNFFAQLQAERTGSGEAQGAKESQRESCTRTYQSR